MNRTHLAISVALMVGVGIGASIAPAIAQAPATVVAVGVAGNPNGIAAWFLEPSTRTIWVCTGLANPGQCSKGHLP